MLKDAAEIRGCGERPAGTASRCHGHPYDLASTSVRVTGVAGTSVVVDEKRGVIATTDKRETETHTRKDKEELLRLSRQHVQREHALRMEVMYGNA
jgi:hypothetical protein